jgi:acetyltransferase-like isoleucine patch superfamily enzyme
MGSIRQNERRRPSVRPSTGSSDTPSGRDIGSLFGPLHIAETAVIGEHCTLGYPKEARLTASPGSTTAGSPVIIGERGLLFNHVVVYEGVEIGESCVVEDRVRIGYDCRIGPRARLVYGAYICDRVTIGADARVAGFVCDGTAIGERSTVMGSLVHEYTSPHQDWWETHEDSPIVESDTVVSFGATVVGAVRIGPRSYVAAGAVVTRDVPPDHVVVGANVHTPADRWSGRRLPALLRHWESMRQAADISQASE